MVIAYVRSVNMRNGMELSSRAAMNIAKAVSSIALASYILGQLMDYHVGFFRATGIPFATLSYSGVEVILPGS